jgi:AP-2 complex subunit sigma-1
MRSLITFASLISCLTFIKHVHLFVVFCLSHVDVFCCGKVYAILDEIFLAGEIEETSKDVVLARLDELQKLD